MESKSYLMKGMFGGEVSDQNPTPLRALGFLLYIFALRLTCLAAVLIQSILDALRKKFRALTHAITGRKLLHNLVRGRWTARDSIPEWNSKDDWPRAAPARFAERGNLSSEPPEPMEVARFYGFHRGIV